MVAPCVEGHPLIWRGRKRAVPSRYVRRFYREHVGPLDDGLHVHHACGNPWCLQPAHLELLTPVGHHAAHRAMRVAVLARGFDETA